MLRCPRLRGDRLGDEGSPEHPSPDARWILRLRLGMTDEMAVTGSRIPQEQ